MSWKCFRGERSPREHRRRDRKPWRHIFRSIDPNTGDLPTSLFTGFLPPGVSAYVTYMVRPTSDVQTGDRIRARATVVFDTNPPKSTRHLVNTSDAAPPTSTVAPLPAIRPRPGFTMRWSGSDDPGSSGIAFYDIHVATDDGSFVLWLAGTTATSAVFHGAFGHHYRFYSVATDNAGNQEATPVAAEAMTYVPPPKGAEDRAGQGRRAGRFVHELRPIPSKANFLGVVSRFPGRPGGVGPTGLSW